MKMIWSKNKITANPQVEFLPITEMIRDIKTINLVRDKLDEWGQVGYGVLRLPDFGSRMKIEKLLSGVALLCEVNILSVSRHAVNKVEPYSGKVPPQNRPQSLQALPFSPPPKYEGHSEPDSVIPGSAEKKMCSDCSGAGIVTCGECHGHREVICPRCDGEGKVERYEAYEKRKGGRIVLRKCSLCEGARTLICSKCDGTGQVQCRHCKGHGAFRHYEVMHTKYKADKQFELFSQMSDYPEAFLDERGKGNLLWDGDLFENLQRKDQCWCDAEKQLGRYSSALGYIASKQPAVEDTRGSYNSWFRWGIKVEILSYYRVEYSYDGRSYTVYLIGDDLHVHADVLPSISGRLFSFFSSNIQKLLSSNNEEASAKALILASFHMAWADGQIQEAEKERLRDWIDKSEFSQSTKNSLIKYIRKPLEDFKITKYVHSSEDAEKILQIAWQTVLADGLIKEAEDRAFLEMAKDLALDDETIFKIKEQARKEMGLSDKGWVNIFRKREK